MFVTEQNNNYLFIQKVLFFNIKFIVAHYRVNAKLFLI